MPMPVSSRRPPGRKMLGSGGRAGVCGGELKGAVSSFQDFKGSS